MANHIRHVRQLAQEASTENGPEKLISLIDELNKTLALLRHNRKTPISPKDIFQDKEGSGRKQSETVPGPNLSAT
jgi:hypothetical protein